MDVVAEYGLRMDVSGRILIKSGHPTPAVPPIIDLVNHMHIPDSPYLRGNDSAHQRHRTAAVLRASIINFIKNKIRGSNPHITLRRMNGLTVYRFGRVIARD
jgi:hypothetical protein